MDKVSFTGISNTAAQVCGKAEPRLLRLRVDLNDEGIKDLSQFSTILKKFPHPAGKDSIAIYRSVDPDNMSKFFMINGKIVKLEDSNIPIFQKIGELTKRIINYDDPLPIDENSLKKAIKKLNSVMGLKSEKTTEMIALGSHDNNVRGVAERMNIDLDEIMKDYFE